MNCRRLLTLALSSTDDGLASIALGKDGGCLDNIQLLSGEGVLTANIRMIHHCLHHHKIEDKTYAFFLPPFLPFDSLLFFPKQYIGLIKQDE